MSHAKADGDATARAIIDYVESPGHDVPIHTFYDAQELIAGEDFEARFEEEIGRGTLLAIVSDVYDSRPWCVFELTTAKRRRRPIVLADVGRSRTSRTFPYGANLPRIRVEPSTDQTGWIERLLVQTLSVGLRCDLFEVQAEGRLQAAELAPALVLPRPPELFDLIDADDLARTIVYPDPPLGKIEAALIDKALARIGGDTRIMTLSEVK